MGAVQAFREAFARRAREGVRRYMERHDLWSFGATDLANLIKARGVPVTSWAVKGWLEAEYIPKYEMGRALAGALELDYDAMMAPPEAPQPAEDAPESRPALRIASSPAPKKKKPATVRRGAK